MAITVCIAKDDQGAFSVYKENEQAEAQAPASAPEEGGMPAPAPEAQEQQNAQPAPDLKSALMIAAKMLSQPDEAAKQSMFDQGMAKTAPVRGGQGMM